MKTPRDKYLNDPYYKRMVDMMVNQLKNCNFTPSEMREMAVFACVIVEQKYGG